MTTQTNLRVRRAAAALALALSSALAVAGEASGHATLRQQTVRFGELNVHTAQGVATLYRRIASAAEEVCAPASLPGSRIVSPDHKHCVARAVAEAIAKIDRVELNAYYAARSTTPRDRGFLSVQRLSNDPPETAKSASVTSPGPSAER
jgi:UrcA family protein